MGQAISAPSLTTPTYNISTISSHFPNQHRTHLFNPTSLSFPSLQPHCHTFLKATENPIVSFSRSPLPSETLNAMRNATKDEVFEKPGLDSHEIPEELVEEMVTEALVWSSLHGLVVGDKDVQMSGKVPGVGMVHAPVSLLPVSFPQSDWRQACDLAPLFNELVDRVSLDAEFIQESLSRTKKVDEFTGRLLDIHSKMLELNKKEDIRLGLHRSDYMLDSATKELLQIELNTVASSFPGLSCRVTELHRFWLHLLNHYGKRIGLDSKKVPGNTAVIRFAEALAQTWNEYNNRSSIILVVVQPEEHNMYDQLWLSSILKDQHGITSIRKSMAEVDSEAELRPDGRLFLGDYEVAVIYFRAGYSPNNYPTESEWRARLLMEQSCAVKCPSISYHLAGTKKIQQELAKPNVLERFVDNPEDISKLRKCFAGLWSLDDPNIVKDAMDQPELFVLKPQREGGGNNVYGDDVREKLKELHKEGGEGFAAYILMQRIFPQTSDAHFVRKGCYHRDQAISELGIYGAYLRNKEKVILNNQCGYLMRTKVSSSDEGGVAAGFAVLDSIYLT
ncbi:glutathione synthetase, chloroplastic isoform X1 [Amborella trichopoda]|uniref:glutathione synthetase, chloroplastic isoform X1 n=1 Tax=Amborella trichopoda TaxID=13333 RepID=UPI0009C05777|nr:glutathione synthetase, chloroplastic isoform X1 [Amborella trichopoda]|eukprot:XP_020527125.1 glutathione synthetase, chloroplastic isoform X1 [Amborella trichopoda]